MCVFFNTRSPKTNDKELMLTFHFAFVYLISMNIRERCYSRFFFFSNNAYVIKNIQSLQNFTESSQDVFHWYTKSNEHAVESHGVVQLQMREIWVLFFNFFLSVLGFSVAWSETREPPNKRTLTCDVGEGARRPIFFVFVRDRILFSEIGFT